ncbi:MAG: DNA mismatch endonuclease Vsr [Chloroflexia bacterium]|jgi:DNA mismatch endonuclease (patch repair protein)|nr:DNA mismatch endonuclease Vsr [Chloroflexia bacterium]
MAAVKSQNTKPEVYVRRMLHAAGFRYRLHAKALPGKPDIVLARYKTVVLVQGCFWHGHNCKPNSMPQNNRSYWSAKIERNISRDRRNRVALEQAGWNVVDIWECEIERSTTSLIERLQNMRTAQDTAA